MTVPGAFASTCESAGFELKDDRRRVDERVNSVRRILPLPLRRRHEIVT
jgi:hypothetical protein